jgi:CheY-like chemotaxis protein
MQKLKPETLSLGILVVDDTENMRSLVRMILHDLGFDNVREAGNSQEALKILETFEANLIISDWNMPGMSGTEFLATIRVNHPDLPFLMVTAESSKDVVVEAIQYGVTDFILKPINAELFEQKLMRVFG